MATELERVAAGARARLKELEARHPDLDAWLVLALRADQVKLPSELSAVLATFPGVFVASAHRRRAEPLAQRIAAADRIWVDLSPTERRTRHELAAKLAPFEPRLTIHPDVLVELRFETLDYAVIDALRRDPLVDRDRTPRTRSSIQIVLGTARDLGGLDAGGSGRGAPDGEEGRLSAAPLHDGNPGGR